MRGYPRANFRFLGRFGRGFRYACSSILEGYDTIAHNLTFCAERERLYGTKEPKTLAQEQLMNALVELYTAILHYQAAVIPIFTKTSSCALGKEGFLVRALHAIPILTLSADVPIGLVSRSRFQEQLDALQSSEDQAAIYARLPNADLMQRMDLKFEDLDQKLDRLQKKILDAINASCRAIKSVTDYVEAETATASLTGIPTYPTTCRTESAYHPQPYT